MRFRQRIQTFLRSKIVTVYKTWREEKKLKRVAKARMHLKVHMEQREDPAYAVLHVKLYML